MATKQGRKTEEMVKPKNKGGHPFIFTPALGKAVCDRISKGESLRSVCRDPKMPHVETVLNWVWSSDDIHKEFRKNFEIAREMRAEHVFEETMEISDDTSGDMMEVVREVKKNGKTEKVKEFVPNHTAVHRARLRVDTRRWFLARMAPKKFGEKIDITSGGKAIKQPRSVAINYVVPKVPKEKTV